MYVIVTYRYQVSLFYVDSDYYLSWGQILVLIALGIVPGANLVCALKGGWPMVMSFLSKPCILSRNEKKIREEKERAEIHKKEKEFLNS